MKKLLIRVFLLFTTFAISYSSLVYLYYLYTPRNINTAKLLANVDNINAITIGGSHSSCIDFETANLNGIHFWDGQQDISQSTAILEKRLSQGKNIKVVFYSISPISLRDYQYDPDSQFRTRFYQENPDISPIDKDWRRYIQSRIYYLNWMPADFWHNIWNNILISTGNSNTTEYYKPFAEVFRENQNSLLTQSSEETSQINNARLNVHQHLLNLYDKHPGYIQTIAQQIERLIKICSQYNVQLVLYSPPYHESLYEILPTRSFEILDRLMDGITQNYGVIYCDFSRDPSLTSRKDLFLNGDHLNLKGAQLLSKRIMERVKFPK